MTGRQVHQFGVQARKRRSSSHAAELSASKVWLCIVAGTSGPQMRAPWQRKQKAISNRGWVELWARIPQPGRKQRYISLPDRSWITERACWACSPAQIATASPFRSRDMRCLAGSVMRTTSISSDFATEKGSSMLPRLSDHDAAGQACRPHASMSHVAGAGAGAGARQGRGMFAPALRTNPDPGARPEELGFCTQRGRAPCSTTWSGIEAFHAAAQGSGAALHRPGALDQRYGPAPGRRIAEQLVIEMLVHSWGLATAMGHPHALVPDLVESALPVVREIYDGLPQTPGGSFATPGSAPQRVRTRSTIEQHDGGAGEGSLLPFPFPFPFPLPLLLLLLCVAVSVSAKVEHSRQGLSGARCGRCRGRCLFTPRGSAAVGHFRRGTVK